MPLELNGTELENDLDALLRFQGLLLQVVEGARGPELDREYRRLRSMLLADGTYRQALPNFVRHNQDLGSLWPALKSFSPQWEPRRVEVRRQFADALALAENLDFQKVPGDAAMGFNSSAWTGATTASERIKAVKTLMPIAQNAIECLIASLSMPRHNGGPLLDEIEIAIKNLRNLHAAIGEILTAADEGKLFDSVNDGLLVEASRFAKRAARALRDDPMPYATSALILGILTACGLPDIGGYLTGVALTMKKGGS